MIGCTGNDYGHRFFCCQIVIGFEYAEGNNVLACVNDFFNCYAILSDNKGNSRTVGCDRCRKNVCSGIINLGIVLDAADGNTCLCNGEFYGLTFSANEVFIACEDRLNVVSTRCRRNGLIESTLGRGCVFEGYSVQEIGCVGRCICCLTKRPTIHRKLFNNDLRLGDLVGQSDIVGLACGIPLVVCLIDKSENRGIGSSVYTAVVGYGVEFCTHQAGGQDATVVYLGKLIVSNLRNLYGCLFDNELTGCNEILVVGVGCGKSCSICACRGGKLGGINTVNKIFNGYVTCLSICRAKIACLTVYPRVDGGFFYPLVLCLGDGVGELDIVAGIVGPNVVFTYKRKDNFISTNVDTAVINNNVSLIANKSGGKGCSGVYLRAELFGNGRCIDLLLRNGNGDLYLTVLVVACCAGKYCRKGVDACVANGGGIFLDAPVAFNAIWELDPIKDKITIDSCYVGNQAVCVGCLANYNSRRNLRTVVVFTFGKCNSNGVSAGVLDRVNDLAVFLKYEFENALVVGG